MASKCDLTGKGKQFGHNVSFSLRRTKRVFKPNLQKVRAVVAGETVRVKVCTTCLRSGRITKPA